MTRGELRAWTKITEGSKHRWTLDSITWANRSELLFYRGGANGKFIWINPGGKLQLGTYVDAFPHIGEATFTVTFTKQFGSIREATDGLLAIAGVELGLRGLGKGVVERI
jgi:hypothetical protein